MTQSAQDPSIVKNRETLLSVGVVPMRRHALDILETGVAAGDPGAGTRAKLRLDGRWLLVDGKRYDLNEVKRIFLVGAGKGSFPIAQAVEEILGDRLCEGLLVVKHGEKRRLSTVEILEAGHPSPDRASEEAAGRILDLVDRAGPGDIVLAAITGGSSSLVTSPAGDMTLDDIREANDLLLRSGAVIREVNVVRRHLCRIKGGRLAFRIQPAHAITLTLDTAPDGMPWPDMCLPDPATFRDAIEVLEHYGLLGKLPPRVRKYLEDGLHHPEWETVKSLEGMHNQIVMVGDPRSMCAAAAARSEELGYQGVILAGDLEGEAREAGICLSGIAKEILARNRPFKPPCALITGGETTVTINGSAGEGGPNQEFVLGFALKLDGSRPWVCASLDSDGTDGPTAWAGGLVDSQTREMAARLGLSLSEHLRNHRSSEALIQLNGAIETGHTGTNLQNLRVILIGEEEGE